MPSPFVSIGVFCQSVAPIACSLFHSALGVLQAVLALSQEIVQNVVPFEKSVVKLASDLSQCLHESVVANFGVRLPDGSIHPSSPQRSLLCTVNYWGPNAEHEITSLPPAPSIVQSHEALALCSQARFPAGHLDALTQAFVRLADSHTKMLDRIDETNRLHNAQLQSLLTFLLAESRLSAARSNLQSLISNHTMTRALVMTAPKAELVWRQHEAEHSHMIEEARREVKVLEKEVANMQRSLMMSSAPSTSSNPLMKLFVPKQIGLSGFFSRDSLKRLGQASWA